MSRIAARHWRRFVVMVLSTQCLVSIADTRADTQEPASVTVQQAASMSDQRQAVIIDVREDEEWRQGHIPNAIHIPLSQLAGRMSELEQYKNGVVITQCRSGKRSSKAANMLKRAGFSQVYNMNGGLVAWLKSGLPSQ